MGTLYLVRHGQASFGATDYDRLSALGTRQCQALGEWFGRRGIRFDAVLRGSLRRHQQSLQGIVEGCAAAAAPALPEALEWPGLNEYDGEAVLQALRPGPIARADTAEAYRHHFRLLREGLGAWMAGSLQPAGMPSYADWRAGIVGALDHVRSTHDGNVLLVSSGGPISTAVAQVLRAPPESAIDLNFRLRNSALTEFHFNPGRHMLVSFNALPHLDAPERHDWVTFT